MKLPELTVLSRDEMERVHRCSLEILAKAGLRVMDKECRDILARAGAKIDADGETVRIPPELTAECLARAPSEFPLHGRNGETLRVTTESRCLGSLVIDPWIIDYPTRLPRKPVLADVARHARLGDALGEVDYLYRMDMPPSDVPDRIAFVKTLEAFFLNTTKPVLAAPASAESLRDWLEVAEILSGGRPLSEKPFLMLGAPVTTPLKFEPLNAAIMKEGVRRGLPFCGQTEPIAGMTAPLSFAGGLLLGNAENLFQVVLTQLLRPGVPFMYSAGNALADLRSGNVIFYNADKMLWKIAALQMAKFYRLPIEAEITGSMVGRYDVQCGIEQALLLLPAMVNGGGLFNGLGSCFNACGMSAEMIVIHADLARLAKRIGEGIRVDETMLACDSIVSVGPGGSFLEEPLTIEMLRSGEFFTGGSFDRLGERNPHEWENSMLARAHERVEELLSRHVPAVSEKTAEEVRRWARQKERGS